MRHLQPCAAAADIVVPPHLLTVLQDIVFVRIGIIHNLIPIAPLCEARNTQRAGAVNRYQWTPAHKVTLIGRIIAWVVTVVAILAIVHHAPDVHAEGHIPCVIEVGQAQCMTQFVDEDTHTVGTRRSDIAIVIKTCRHQLAATGTCGKHLPIDGSAARGLLRPDSVLIAAIVLPKTGINKKDHIHRPVAVVVEAAPVCHLTHRLPHGLGAEGGQVHVVRRAPVGTIISIGAIQFHRSDGNELGQEVPLTLFCKIVADAAVGAMSRIEHPVARTIAIEVVIGSDLLMRLTDAEGLVGKLHKHYGHILHSVRFQGSRGSTAHTSPHGLTYSLFQGNRIILGRIAGNVHSPTSGSR